MSQQNVNLYTNVINIRDGLRVIKIMRVSTMNIIAPTEGARELPNECVVVKGANVFIKNTYTNLSERIGNEYVLMTANGEMCDAKTEIDELKGLKLFVGDNIPATNDYKLMCFGTIKMYVVVDKIAYVYVIVSIKNGNVEHELQLDAGCRMMIVMTVCNTIRGQLDTKNVDEQVNEQQVNEQQVSEQVVSEQVVSEQQVIEPKPIKTETIAAKPAQDSNKIEIPYYNATTPQADVFCAIMAVLEPAQVYGIRVLTPGKFIRRDAEFNIHLKSDVAVAAFIVSKSYGTTLQYSIKPIAISNGCVKVSFDGDVYAIGFTDPSGRECVDAPIERIKLVDPIATM